MTSTTLTRPITSAPAVTTSRLTFGGIVASEWIKALSLRSIRWSIGTSIVAGIAMSLAMSFALSTMMDGAVITNHTEYLAAITSFPASLLALVFGVLGVFVFSSEYASGMILSTLTAAPRRGPLMAAKALVLTMVAAAVALLVVVGGVLVGIVVLPEAAGSAWTLQTLTSLLGTTCFLVAVALFGFALAGMLRSTAGAITAMVAVVFLLPTMLQIVGQVSGWAWVGQVWTYLPASLGSILGMGIVEGGVPVMNPALHTPGYGEAVAALALWVLVPMAVAARSFFTRDAK